MKEDLKFRSLFENMIDGSAMHELKYNEEGIPVDYIILDANPSFEKQLGISIKGIIGKTSCEAYGVSEPPFFDVYKQVVFTGKPIVFETFFPPLDKYFSISAYPTHETGFATIFEDITERKRSNEALQLSLEKYKILFNSFPVGLTVSDSSGQIIETNTIAEELLGISEAEQRRRQISGEEWHIIRVDGSPMPSEEYASVRALKEGKPVSNIEMGIFKSENDICWINVSATPIHFDGFGVLIAYNEITEQKRIKEALEETNSYLENLFNYANAPIIVWDPQFRITRFNHAFEHLTGLTEGEVLGKSLNILFPFEKVEESMALIRNTIKGERWETVEIQIRHKDNSIKTVLWNSATLFAGDGITPVATIAQGQDITERIIAELEIIQKNIELQKLNAEKDKFFSIIAHDLKSPFSSILGFSEILVEQVKAKDFEGIEKYAEIIQDSSNRAMELLMNLMEWALSQTGRMEYNPEYLEIVELINGVEMLFVDIAKQKSITICKAMPSHFPIFADRAMMSTVLRNLISNAIKFTNPGGKITISAEGKEKGLIVKICDSGVGISKSNIGKLFQIDKSFSTQGTANEKGTGLGLILCKEFIEKHNGKIWVESEIGKGSSFYFLIPNPKRDH
ncbi:MAG: Sensor protein [uncultured bacterium]|nr:MAG: Sensor protein [uncultured bacterium]